LATRSENLRNKTRLRSDNRSGTAGVSWHDAAGKWSVRIWVNGKQRHIGVFSELAVAIEARRKAEREHYGDFAPNVGWFADQRLACRQARPF
jgi:hypothetical protein